MTVHTYKVSLDEETTCRCGKEVCEGETAFEILDEYTVSIACGLCSKACVKAEVAVIKANPAKYLFQITF